ncbi:MAG: lamin tail domain-containing protein, partial [Planctomycetota bacterium]|nr:lamin tail domain-containing protein [Planctomycetota bacterium]
LRQAGLFPGVGAPVFNRPGGRVAPGFAMTLSRPGGSGTIHYTLDGSDPRVPVSGDVSASAITYGGAVAIQDRSHVKARVRSGANWSALSEAIFTVNDPREVLRISEIMYNPPGGNGLEFLEVHNTDPASVDLSGLGFADGIRFLFEDGASLGPGEYLVLVSEALVFASRFPDVEIAGVYDGLLANGGERVALKDSRGQTILAVDYDDGGFWPIAADGLGRSLVPVDLDGDPDDAENWRASTDVGGSPGSADPLAPSTSVVVSEVLANSASPLEDAVELFNRTGSSVDVSGWYLSDRRDTLAALEKFRIPDGTVLAPGGRAVIYEFQFNGNSADPMSFALAAAGGAVYLSEADAGGVLTGYIVEARYGPQDSGVSFGRIATSEGPAFGALSERTFGVDFPAVVEEFRQGDGMDNAPPRVGPVMINEIMYHPAADREEFVELFNPTGAPIELHDGGLGRGWQLSGVLDALGLGSYEFEPGAAVPTRGFLLLVAIDPDVFRTLHAVPASVPIHGPYAGRLDNGGERLKLSRPLDVDGGVAHAVVDVER